MTSDLITLKPQALQLDQNPAAVYLAGLGSEVSRRTMLGALQVIAGLLSGGRTDWAGIDWASLRFQHVAAIRAKLADTYSAATANKMLSALRGVLKAAYQLGQLPAEEYHRAADIDGVRGDTVLAGRGLAKGELAALMAACENDASPAGIRDAAILALAYTGGLRRSEIAALTLASYEPETGRLLVHGKRNKYRYVYLVNGAAAAMDDWLTVRGSEPGALFLAINKGGHIRPGVGITSQAILNLCQKRGAQAGLQAFSPHDLRRTFISDLLGVGVDIATVAKLAGHASVQTTARYDRRPEEAKRQAVELLHIPYHRRKPVIQDKTRE